MTKRNIAIANRTIGEDEPCFIIAEIGANHNQQFSVAKQLIDCAVEAGADAVKFQSFKVEHWISKDLTEFPTITEMPDLHGALKNAELPYKMYNRTAEYCEKRGIICFSTPSHKTDVNRLYELGTPAFKFGSVQITDLPTIAHAAQYGRPIILSGGASEMSEILRAVETVSDAGNKQLALLHCTSLYPCQDYQLVNLNVLRSFQAMFDFPVGYSDHTLDSTIIPVAAVAMGAKIIEKHVTLNRSMEGPDHPFALEPAELARMVDSIRKTEQALGSAYRRMLPEETELARLGRRSLVSIRDIGTGKIIHAEDLTIKRPGYGIEPLHFDLVVGRLARCDIEADRVLTWEMI